MGNRGGDSDLVKLRFTCKTQSGAVQKVNSVHTYTLSGDITSIKAMYDDAQAMRFLVGYGDYPHPTEAQFRVYANCIRTFGSSKGIEDIGSDARRAAVPRRYQSDFVGRGRERNRQIRSRING